MREDNESVHILLILFLAMFFWGSAYPVSKYMMCAVHPAFMAFLRHSLGFLPLIPFFIVEQRKLSIPIRLGDIAVMSFIGVFGIAGFALLLFYGVAFSSAATGSTLANTQPIFAVILSPIILKEKLNRYQIVGTISGLFGMVLVTTGGNFCCLEMGSGYTMGNLLLVGAAISMTLYNITLKRYIHTYGGMIPTFFTMLSGSIVLLIVSVFITDWNVQVRNIGNFTNALLIVYLGFFATALPFFLFNYALKFIPVIRAAGFKFLIPVTGVTLSILLISERPSLWTLLGILIVVFSVIILQRKSLTENK